MNETHNEQLSREEFLAAVRESNKNCMSTYEADVSYKAIRIGYLAGTIGACALFFIQFILNQGINIGLYAVILATISASGWYKGIKLHDKSMIAIALVTSVICFILIVMHVYVLLKKANII